MRLELLALILLASPLHATTYTITPSSSLPTAIARLVPGDTLVLADGTYGSAAIACGSNAKNGTSPLPITVTAQHERRAWLRSSGGDALTMTNCAWWNLVGLRVSVADNASVRAWEGNGVRIVTSNNLQLRRLLAVHPNRRCPNVSLGYCNVHAIAVEQSHHLLLEENEVYDFHRHGISVFASRWVTVRRCYANARGTPGAGGGPTGVIFYGTSDSIVENTIAEKTVGLNIAGTTAYDGTAGGYRNRVLGSVTFGSSYGSTVRARRFGGPVLPVGHNYFRDDVFAGNVNVGVYARGAADTVLENVTLVGNGADGVAADQDLGEGAPCSANPEGCSLTLRSVLALGNTGRGVRIDTGIVHPWLLDYVDATGNAGGNFPTSETIGDATGSIQHSLSVPAPGMGMSGCLAWVPDGSALKRAGLGGVDIGAHLTNRYVDGAYTATRLWDRTTGAFPCGARIPGVNDTAGLSCFDVHTRLHINTATCPFPSGY